MKPERSFWGNESPNIFFPDDNSIRTYNSRAEDGQAPWIYYTGGYVQEIEKRIVTREKYLKKKIKIEEIATKLARKILWGRWMKFPEERQKEYFYDGKTYLYRIICPWCDIEDPWWSRCTPCEFFGCLDPLTKLRNFWTAHP